jgi:hypothetical protein
VYKRQAREQAAQQATSQAEFEQNLAEFSKKAHSEALKKINALNPDDDTYEDQVADVWSAKDVEVSRWMLANSVQPAARQVEPAAENAAGQPPATGDDLDPWAYARSQAEQADIDPEDQFFVNACHNVPSRDDQGKPRSLEDMVSQVIKDTKAYHARLEARFKQRQEKESKALSEKHQQVNQPLGRSGGSPPAADRSGEVKPMWIDDALEKVAAERRI